MIKVFSSALRDPTTGAARPVTIEVHGQALLVRLGQAMPKGEDAPHHATADFTAQRAEIVAALGEREAERTPETVLRAMLRAYDEAAVDAWRAWSRECDRQNSDAAMHRPIVERSRATHRAKDAASRADRATDTVRLWLALSLDGNPLDGVSDLATGRDYQARLAGTRALDAAPLGEEAVPS